MTTVDNILISKKEIIAACLKFQTHQVDTIKKQLIQIQESANEEKSSTEEGGDSFKEQLQVDREMYNKKLKDALDNLEVLHRIDINKKSEAVSLGAVVITESQSFIVSTGVGEVKVDGKTFFAISTISPIFKVMSGKKKGESFLFRDKQVNVLEVY